MKIEKVKNPMFENIGINKLFFTDYLPILNPICVKIYMYCLYVASEGAEFTFESLAGDLRIEKNELEDNLLILQSHDLLQVQAGTIVLNNLALNELNKTYTIRTAKNPLQSNLSDEKRKEHVQMMKSVSDRFFGGNMPPSWFTQIELWQEKFGFSADVIFMLFQHCEMNRSMTKAYVRTVAEEWHKNGIKTGDDLGKYLAEYDEYCKMRSAIAKKLNIKRYFNEYEESIIKKWYFTYGYTMSIVEIALKKSIYRTNATLGTFDAIISDWHRNGLKTVIEIEEYEAERKKRYAEKTYAEKPATAKSKSDTAIKSNFEQRKYDDSFFESISDIGFDSIKKEEGNN